MGARGCCAAGRACMSGPLRGGCCVLLRAGCQPAGRGAMLSRRGRKAVSGGSRPSRAACSSSAPPARVYGQAFECFDSPWAGAGPWRRGCKEGEASGQRRAAAAAWRPGRLDAPITLRPRLLMPDTSMKKVPIAAGCERRAQPADRSTALLWGVSFSQTATIVWRRFCSAKRAPDMGRHAVRQCRQSSTQEPVVAIFLSPIVPSKPSSELRRSPSHPLASAPSACPCSAPRRHHARPALLGVGSRRAGEQQRSSRSRAAVALWRRPPRLGAPMAAPGCPPTACSSCSLCRPAGRCPSWIWEGRVGH